MRRLVALFLLLFASVAQAATTVQFTVAERNNMLNTFRTDVPTGALIRIYDGGVPATADTSLSGNNILCVLTIPGAFSTGAASSGSITLGSVSSSADNLASGQAAFWRLVNAAGSTTYAQGTAATSGGSVTLNGLQITIHGQCTSTGGTISIAP